MKKQQLFRVFVVLNLLLFTILVNAQEAIPPSNFYNPDAGSFENPYTISNLNNLLWLTENPIYWVNGYYFLQTNEIDAYDTRNLNEGEGWMPIGSGNSNGFEGFYDGNGYGILYLYINRPSNGQGFFRKIGNLGVVENLRLFSTYLNVKGWAGCLSGSCDGNVSNCSSTGSILATNDYVGGLIGNCNNGTIEFSHSSTNVNGDNYVGGLIGSMTFGSISNSYALEMFQHKV